MGKDPARAEAPESPKRWKTSETLFGAAHSVANTSSHSVGSNAAGSCRQNGKSRKNDRLFIVNATCPENSEKSRIQFGSLTLRTLDLEIARTHAWLLISFQLKRMNSKENCKGEGLEAQRGGIYHFGETRQIKLCIFVHEKERLWWTPCFTKFTIVSHLGCNFVDGLYKKASGWLDDDDDED